MSAHRRQAASAFGRALRTSRLLDVSEGAKLPTICRTQQSLTGGPARPGAVRSRQPTAYILTVRSCRKSVPRF